MTIGLNLHFLPADHYEAIQIALVCIVDEFQQDICLLEAGSSWQSTTMSMYLPKKYTRRYSLPFANSFVVATIITGWKLTSPKSFRLDCVAEELALNAIIERASAVLEMHDIEPDFSLLEGLAFFDQDYLLLFDPRLDGIEDDERSGYLGFANLHFEDWFVPFEGGHVHPYCLD